MSDACYVEQRDFRALTSTEDGWAIRKSLALRIGIDEPEDLATDWGVSNVTVWWWEGWAAVSGRFEERHVLWLVLAFV